MESFICSLAGVCPPGWKTLSYPSSEMRVRRESRDENLRSCFASAWVRASRVPAMSYALRSRSVSFLPNLLSISPTVLSFMAIILDPAVCFQKFLEQRERTNEQKAREFQKLKEIEAERAKERQEAGNNQYSLPENLPEVKRGDSRDLAAAKVGMSGKTAEVVNVIDALEQTGEKVLTIWDKSRSAK